MEIDKIILGDCFEVLKEIPDSSIDMIFTDIPYMISKEIKIYRQSNAMKYNTKRWKYQGRDIDLDFGIWDNFDSLDDYLNYIYDFLNQAKRVLRKGGHCLFFSDKYKISYWWQWAIKNDFKPRQPLFWHKLNPVPMARKVGFMNSLEMIWWMTKETTSKQYAVFNHQLGQHHDVFESPICQGKERYDFGRHPTQKPVKIIKEILQFLTNEGEIVLDPFMGSGTTPVACIETGRHYIGIEKSEEYFEIAQKRIENAKKQLNLGLSLNEGK